MTEQPWTGRVAIALLADKEEDRFTEFLAQLLKAKAVLAEFLSSVCGLPELAAQSAGLTVATQVRVTKGRPDLVITGPGTLLIFEAKVGAWLHENQLGPYATAQAAWKNENPSALSKLFVIAPEASLAGLLATSRIHLVASGVSSDVGVISWQKIVTAFEGLRSRIHNEELRSALRLFGALVEARLGVDLDPFTGEEEQLLSDPVTGRSVTRVLDLLQRVVKQLRSQEPRIAQTVAVGMRYQGYTLRYDERWWWLGLWPPVWQQTGISPIVLQTPGIKSTDVAYWSDDLPRPLPYRTDHEGMAVPLPFPASEDINSAVRRTADTVVRFVIDRPSTGGARGSAVVQPT